MNEPDDAARSGNAVNEPMSAESASGFAAPMGTEVRDANGEPLGRVVAVWPTHLFVEAAPGVDAGFWLPLAAVAGASGPGLVLNVTRADARARGWTERPASHLDEAR